MSKYFYDLMILYTVLFYSCNQSPQYSTEKTKTLIKVLERSLKIMDEECNIALHNLKIQVHIHKAGHYAKNKEFLKQAEVLREKLNHVYFYIDKALFTLYKLKSSQDIYRYMKGKQGKEFDEVIYKYRTFLKRHHPEQLALSDSITQLDHHFIQRFFLNSGSSPGVAIAFLKQKQIALKAFQLRLFRNLSTLITENPDIPHFNQYKAYAIPRSNVVKQGELFEMDIFISKYTKNLPMRMKANGKPIPVENGIGKVKIPTTKPGKFTWEGEISMKNKGRDTTIRFVQTYTVIPKP